MTSLTDDLQQMYTDMLAKATLLKDSPFYTTLTNDDFVNGTYIITQPGTYRLGENISFNPNNLQQMNALNPQATSYESGDVLPSQYTYVGGIYDPAAYGIGFFAAISVTTCDDVLIDLNGFTIEQSVEHALQQRFFAVIELADQPFISAQGPHDFGTSVQQAKNCYIMNGTIGLSAHHGIHGNSCENILLTNITFKNYEVAPCALNGAKNIAIVNCTATGSRGDVPVIGTFSSSRFIRPYLNYLVDNGYTGTLTVNGVEKNAATVKMELKTAMNNVYEDIVIKRRKTIDKTLHPTEWQLFNNSQAVVDGNSYGFLFNGLGVAVNGFPSSVPSTPSQNIYMEKVCVKNHQANIREILAIPSTTVNTNVYGSGSAQIDPVGSVFQTQNKDADGNYVTIDANNKYLGNAVANAQAIVAQAIYAGFSFGSLDTSRITISNETLKWINGETDYSTVVPKDIFKCNGDSMFHVNKGVIIFKIDGCKYVYMLDCTVETAFNYGAIGSNLGDEDYLNQIGFSHPDATYFGYGGANIRGWSLSSTQEAVLENCTVKNLTASYGTAYGFDIHQASEYIQLIDCTVDGLTAGPTDTSKLSMYAGNPTSKPEAIGFHCEQNANEVSICEPEVKNLMATYKTTPYSINCDKFYEVSKCELNNDVFSL